MGRCGERTDTQAAPGLAHLQGLVGSGSCPAPCSDNLFLAETAVCSYWSRTSRAWVSHQREAIGARVHSPLKCELSRALAGLCVVLPLSGDFLCRGLNTRCLETDWGQLRSGSFPYPGGFDKYTIERFQGPGAVL